MIKPHAASGAVDPDTRREAVRGVIEPKIDPQFVTEFIGRLDDTYFVNESDETALRDATHLSEISYPGPPHISFEDPADRDTSYVQCTVYTFDFPGLFSLLTGLLAVSGFDIKTGRVYTFRSGFELKRTRHRRGGRVRILEHRVAKPRPIIDRFVGRLPVNLDRSSWQERFSSLVSETWSQIRESEFGAIEGVDLARRNVYEEVSRSITDDLDSERALYPVEIEVSSDTKGTHLRVLSEDTPYFLFTLGNAVALQQISIESVQIKTEGPRIEDEIVIQENGAPITDENRIRRIKLLILMTKQFTYFLGRAPDPNAALLRYESLCAEIVGQSSKGDLTALLSNPNVLTDLARILGTSDFIWEDFVRVQYESLLPMLEEASREERLSRTDETLEKEMTEAIGAAETTAEKQRALNEFKNREIYLIDLDHIVHPNRDFLFLSKRLTRLAELVIESAVEIAYSELANRYGTPVGFAGLPTPYAIFGLGKLGGAALGYASDIELLFVYSDSGSTQGDEVIRNAEFFDRCFRNATNLVEAKQEGIFHIDLRLRPHGSGGPLAVSVDSFCEYYGPGGAAHSYELLSLVRMRRVGGDRELGLRIERLRDEFVYSTDAIDMGQLKELRERQLAEKTKTGKLNAKFSPGALVDLEYSVQIIQCRYGRENPALRTPRIHVALAELVASGYLDSEEEDQIVESYHFLRRLINGLRMLRGSAKDLFLPEPGSTEYRHLARRIGYEESDELSSAQLLEYDFETRTAVVRHFVESRLGRESIPGKPIGNAADMVLSDSMPEDLMRSILAVPGLKDIDRAREIVERMRGTGPIRILFARLAVLVWDILKRLSDPDMALNNWERYSSALPDLAEHYRELLEQPQRCSVLLQIFSGSQFLADTLIGTPVFLDWVAEPALLHRVRDAESLVEELKACSAASRSSDEWYSAIREVRRREILRIGTRDICLGAPMEDIVEELTIVADACVGACLDRAWRDLFPDHSFEDTGFSMYAFGKLGGRELNYSSDIDLLATYTKRPDSVTEEDFTRRINKVVETLRSMLSDYTDSGYVYRVDLRLRPYGRSGALVPGAGAIEAYYREHAAPWEHQALVKLRPIGGDLVEGDRIISLLREIVASRLDPGAIREGIRRMRESAANTYHSTLRGTDIKNGRGGIRDIEFLVQGLQLESGERVADLTGNTLDAIEQLASWGVFDRAQAEEVREDYLYFRRIEHFLQLLEDRQVHAIPKRRTELEALARRLHGHQIDVDAFIDRIDRTIERNRIRFDGYVGR